MRLLLALCTIVLLIISLCNYTKQAESPIKYTIQTLVTGLDHPAGLHVFNNEIYFVNQYKHVVQKKISNGITTIAGSMNMEGFADGQISSSQLANPYGVFVIVDGSTTLAYIADQYNCRIRVVNLVTNIVSTDLGSSTCAFSEGTKAATKLFNPPGIYVVSPSLYYIADFYNHRVRKVEGNLVSTIAGDGTASFSGEGELATSARLNEPHHVFVRNNKIYIVDKKNHRVRMIDQSNGKIYTVAGNGMEGFSADNVAANSSKLDDPVHVHVTQDEVIYISDHENHRIRRVKNGIITTIAGNGIGGDSADGSIAHLSSINLPAGLFVNDTTGEIFFSDRGSNKIKKLIPTCDNGFNLNENGTQCFTSFCNGIESNELSTVCSGRGKCKGFNKCECDEPSKWGGITCEIPKCNGILGNDPGVCSGNGTCIGVNVCSCNSNYTGTLCQVPKCNGIASNNITVCNRNGQCIGVDSCVCNSNYTGTFCEKPRCGSLFKDDPLVCNSRGSCNSLETCTCTNSAQWGGNLCQNPKCNGIISTSGSVCNGRGTCQSPNTCQCTNTNAWGGSDCEKPKCYSVLQGESNVCSGHGVCTSVDQCSCENGYGGNQCQYPKCNGINSNMATVCNYGNGTCVGVNNCVCNTFYSGPYCQYPKCNGIGSNETSVCNSQGACIAPNICSCNFNYTGQFCEKPRCGTYYQGEALVCNSRGYCGTVENCTCNDTSSWGGNLCQYPKCNGTISNIGTVCSGRGVCQAPNNCSCTDPNSYGGPSCEKPKCYGILQDESNVCTGRGACSGVNQCLCDTGYGGEQCQYPKCFNILSNETTVCNHRNGTCTAPDTCSCNNEWTGSKCDVAICYSFLSNSTSVCSNQRGSCVSPNNCLCKSQYSGSQCEYTTCSGIRSDETSTVCYGNGQCVDYNTCNCTTGYGPPNICQYPICGGFLANDTRVCNNSRGICTEPNICRPLDPICYGKSKNNSMICSGNGACVDWDYCECKTGFHGNECQNWECYGKNYTNPNVCNHGNGTCTSLNNCDCISGWNGNECNVPMCNGILGNSSLVCNNRNGTCSKPGDCLCNTGYTGSDCSIPICFGITNTNTSNVCSGRGECIGYDMCECYEGVTGMDCSLFICFGLNSTNPSVCSGHGECIGKDTCSCYDGFLGVNCKEKAIKEERLLESIGMPKVYVRRKSQVLELSITSAYFKSSFDFESIIVSNNCSNCTWADLMFSWEILDEIQTITYQTEPILAYYHGKISNGLYKISFRPIISLKEKFITNESGFLSLKMKFHNSKNISESVEFFESIPIIESPRRTSSSFKISGKSGMALSSLFTIEEDLNNWNVSDVILYPLRFSIGFEYVDQEGKQSIIRSNEFSENRNISFYLPYLLDNQGSDNSSIKLHMLCKDALGNEYSEYLGLVEIHPNIEDSGTIVSRIRSDDILSFILPYDQSSKKNNDIIYETIRNINLTIENPSLGLSIINQLTTGTSLESKVLSVVSSKLENFLISVNDIIWKDKETNGYLSKQRMSDSDLIYTLSTASNILLSGFVNVSSVCSQLSVVMLNQQPSKLFSDRIEPTSYVSSLINITTSNFVKTSSSPDITHVFNSVSLSTNYILEKYDGLYKEIGLSLIEFDEKLYSNGNSTQLTSSKEFTMFKSGSVIPLSDLQEPIYITFSIETNSTLSNNTLSCQFWNETNQRWESNGCSVHSFNNYSITCKCNHTTLFAAFVEQETPASSEFLKQVSSLYIAQISFGSLFLVVSSIILILLIVFRKCHPVTSRFVTPFIGMTALMIQSAFILITQRGILLGYAKSVLGYQNDFDNSQSTVIQLQNGDLASNIVSNIFTIIVNTMTILAIFSYLYQVLRFQMLKYFYHRIWIRFNEKVPQSETLLKITNLFLSTKVMIIVMSAFTIMNALYWTLWVILIRSGAIIGTTYTHVVSISFTVTVLLLGFFTCGMIALDWIMIIYSKRREQKIIENGQEQTTIETTNISFTFNDLITGKSLEKLQKFDNLITAKKYAKIPFKSVYDNVVRLDSPLYFRAEMVLFVICFSFLVISQIIGLSGLAYRNADSLRMLLVHDSISLLFDILYMISYLFVFGGYPLMILFIRKIQKKTDLGKEDGEELVQLLDHVEGLKLFEWFCEKEFSLENLQLYLELKSNRSLFETFDDSQQVKTTIHHINETYIRNGCLKEVNIPSDCKKSFVDIMKKLEATNLSDIELESLKKIGKGNQLPRELRESISKAIESLQNQILFNLSDTFSRFIFTPQFETYQEIVNYKNNLMKQANLLQ